MKIFKVLFIILTLCTVWTAHADEDFDPAYANKLLDKLSIQLSVAQPTYENLQQAANQLLTLNEQATECVLTTQAKLEEVKLALPEGTSLDTLSEDKQYLIQKKNELEKRLSECRLFSLRAEEAIAAYSETARKLQRSEIYTRGPHLLQQLRSETTQLTTLLSTWTSALTAFSHSNRFGIYQIVFMIFMTTLGLGISYALKKCISVALESFKPTSMGGQLIQTTLTSLKAHAYLCAFIFLFLAYGLNLIWLEVSLETLTSLTSYLLGFFAYYFLIEFLFYPSKPAVAYFHITPAYAKRFSKQLKMLGILVVFSMIFLTMLENNETPDAIYYLTRNGLFTCVALTLGAALLTLNRMPKFLSNYKNTRTLFSAIIMFFVVLILVAEWTGFQALASYLLGGVSFTILGTVICFMLNDWSQRFLTEFNAGKLSWHTVVREKLGLAAKDSLPEIIGLRAGIFLFIWGGYFIALLSIWQLSNVWTYGIWFALEQGYQIPGTDVNLVPSRFILGFIVFSIGILATRFFRNQIQCKVSSSKDKAEREAYGAIFGYSCFTFVVIVSLLVAGFDLQGLAIVAGALSLGIGFGLQSIVNNFISGIILLLERPIKPGDRIAIGKDEGFVKSVNIRSTCITTLENNDIIVPNGELISGQVINQTFKNYHWRVTINIGVAYGSDIKLVEQCLYEAALNHPEVIKDGPDKPKVFFLEFGDSSLNFEMWCIIRNVNLKLFVLSDINFAITQAFEKHRIEIPFPQRDIHVKSSTLKDTKGALPDEG